jgi:hypothetical protein
VLALALVLVLVLVLGLVLGLGLALALALVQARVRVLGLVLVLGLVQARVRVLGQVSLLVWMQWPMQQRVQQTMPTRHLIPTALWNSHLALKMERHPLLHLRRTKRAIQQRRLPIRLKYKLAGTVRYAIGFPF